MTNAAQPLGDGAVDLEKLQTLLALGCELDELDFKEYLDLTNQKDKVELVKDLAAMQSIPTGGYVIVGVDGAGKPSEKFGKLVAAEFDPANLYKIAANYLPTLQLRSTTHELFGITVAIIHSLAPDPPNIPILTKDGQYANDNGKSSTVFVAGDVFVRRGTQSIRWTPADVPALLKPWEQAIREDERRHMSARIDEVQVGTRGRDIARGPLGTLTWRLASDEFDAAVLEAMREQDEITLRRLFLAFGADAAVQLRTKQGDDFDLLLDRLIASLALTLTYGQQGWFRELLVVLVDLYRSVLDPLGSPNPPNENAVAEKLMWRIVVGVEAVGGLAVRLRCYWAIRALAMPSPALSRQIREPSWIRHALTAASWARLLYTQPSSEDAQPVEIGGPTVALARQLVERIPALRPDAEVPRFELNTAPEPFDKVLDSLTQFDALWCVIAVADSGRDNNQYPSFASFYSHRSEPALEVLITDQAVREELLEERAGDLKDAVARVVSVASSCRFSSATSLGTLHLP